MIRVPDGVYVQRRPDETIGVFTWVALVAAWILGVSICGGWHEPEARAALPAAIEPKISECWAMIPLASGTDRRNRWADPWGFSQEGPVKLGTGHARRFHAEGWRRFYVDSPFGKDTDSKGHPKFAFFGALRVPADSPWRKDFEASWRGVAALPGVKLLAYLGNPWADDEFRGALERGDTYAALRMVREAVEPLKRGGFAAIAIDAANTTPEAHAMGEILKWLQLAGFEVFIEATPAREQAWLAGNGFGTIRTTWFARAVMEGGIDSREYPIEACRGERIVLFDGTAWDFDDDGKPIAEWGWKWTKWSLAQGERPAVAPFGVKIEDLGLSAERAPAPEER